MLEPTWNNQISEARKLPDADLQRHASVSTNNRHSCQDCFCCACVAVMRERKERFYVRMTDKFMSGWGPARGKSNVLVVECETLAQAEAIEAAARRRSEMKRVALCSTKPKARAGVLYSWRKFSDMGGPWIVDYHS